MRKYENVDVIAMLGAIVELNTAHYKSDFRYDIESFKKAAKEPGGENSRFLWLSRPSGTWCFKERDVYIKETAPFNTWMGNATLLGKSTDFYQTVIVQDRVLAYAVEIKGLENGRVKGDVCELDYRDHVRRLNRDALPKHTANVKYADGTELTLPYAEYDGKRERLYHQHGEIKSFRADPEDTGALRDILTAARERREKDAQPAVFKVRVQNQKPSIKQQIAAGKKQLAADRAAAPARTAAKTKNNALEV